MVYTGVYKKGGGGNLHFKVNIIIRPWVGYLIQSIILTKTGKYSREEANKHVSKENGRKKQRGQKGNI